MTPPHEERRKLLFRASALAGRPVPERLWHTRDLIPGATVTQQGGDGGVGKSTLALQGAAATVLARPWLGRTPAQGPALYLSSEDDADELHRRADEAAMFYGAGLEELDDLHLWPLADQDPLLVAATHRQTLEPTPLWCEVSEAVGDIKPALVVVDSLADAFGGEENNRAHARQFVALLRRLAIQSQAAVLVLAHPSLHGLTTGSGTSGSTAWSNSVRSRLYLSKPSSGDLDQDPDVRVLSLKKSNYARALPDMRLRRRIGGYEVEGGEAASQLDLVAAQAKADRVFLDLLTAYEGQGRVVSDKPGANYAPTVFAKDPMARGTTRAGLVAAMNRLFADERLQVVTVGPQSRQVRKVVRRLA